MLLPPSRLRNLPPASSAITLSGAKAHDAARGPSQTSACAEATIIASGAPPNPRTDQKRAAQSMNCALNETPSNRLKSLKHRTDSSTVFLDDARIAVPLRYAPPS